MKNKQKLHVAGLSHWDLLVCLAAVKPTLSYPCWQDDYRAAKEKHESLSLFRTYLHKLIEKQCMHDGIRTHFRLRELDSDSWSYPGWQADVKKAEEGHVEWGDDDTLFNQVLQEMRDKQQRFAGVRSRSSVPIEHPRKPVKRFPNGETEAQSDACVICMVAPKSHVFVPCGHLFACAACASKSFGRSQVCPICRKKSLMVMEVFYS
jgi:hypothetical protein